MRRLRVMFVRVKFSGVLSLILKADDYVLVEIGSPSLTGYKCNRIHSRL